MEPEICTKMLKKLSEKLYLSKISWLLHVKIARLDNVFLDFNPKQAQ